MSDEKPIFEIARWPQPTEGYLLKGGELVPLARVPSTRGPQIDADLHATISTIAAVQAALPDERTRATIAAVAKANAAVAAGTPALETMAQVSRTVAAVERFGVPAFVSSSPLSPTEADQLRRDLPRLSPADEAAFAAAARDFQGGT